MINAIAIDDEPPAIKILENFCAKSAIVNMQKTFTDPDKALKHIRKFPVDLLFLDINMPSMSGIELYKCIEQNTMVIFTTAYSEFAVEGFNLNAIDYLLKPYSYDRFWQAVTKANDYAMFLSSSEKKESQYIFVRAEYKLIKIAISEIILVEGLDDYLKIHLESGKTIITLLTMKKIAELLPAKEFIRVHRSFIVPFSKIENVRKKIISIEQKEIPIGSSYEATFFALFKK